MRSRKLDGAMCEPRRTGRELYCYKAGPPGPCPGLLIQEEGEVFIYFPPPRKKKKKVNSRNVLNFPRNSIF